MVIFPSGTKMNHKQKDNRRTGCVIGEVLDSKILIINSQVLQLKFMIYVRVLDGAFTMLLGQIVDCLVQGIDIQR